MRLTNFFENLSDGYLRPMQKIPLDFEISFVAGRIGVTLQGIRFHCVWVFQTQPSRTCSNMERAGDPETAVP